MLKHLCNFKKIISKMDKPLLIITMLLLIFGLLNIVSASSREAVVRYEVSTYFYFFKQLKMILLGLACSLIIINFKTKYYRKIIPYIFTIVLLMSFALFFCGTEVNGAVNWLPLPVIGRVQPSEFAKPIIIILSAVLLEYYARILNSNNQRRYQKIVIILFVGLLIPLFTFLQKDFGSCLIMLISFGLVFLLGPIRRDDKFKTIIIILGMGIVGLAGMFLIKGYLFTPAQMARFDFFNPCSKYETTGYQICNSFIALNNGGLLGVGIGKSKQKYSYIPEPHTDSVFAIVGEEYGVLKCSLIFLAYIIILYRILKISSESKTIRGKYICLGLATYLFCHIVINLGGLFGIIPLTGVPLPFLSYGGSFIISLICSLAVIQRVAIENNTEKIIIKNKH